MTGYLIGYKIQSGLNSAFKILVEIYVKRYLAKSQMGNTCFCDPALKCHEKNQVSGGAVDRGEGRHSNKGKQIASGQESGV